MLYNYDGKSRKSGVYKIINTKNGRIYIGKASRFKERWTKHVSKLRNNGHKNKFLQNDWNKCGEKWFEFYVVEVVEHPDKKTANSNRNLAEEKWIAKYYDGQKQCYNFAKKSDALPRSVFSNDPDITKKILSEKSKVMWKDPEMREKILSRKNAAMKTPEYKEALDAGLKKAWSKPERREKTSLRLKKEHASGARDKSVETLKAAQPRGRITFKARMKSDAEFKKRYQEGGKKNVAKIQERYKTDANFRKTMDAHSRKNIIEYNKSRELTKKPPFVSPEGVVYDEIYNLNEFAKEHGLDSSCAYKLIKGKLKKHRGWRLKQ